MSVVMQSEVQRLRSQLDEVLTTTETMMKEMQLQQVSDIAVLRYIAVSSHLIVMSVVRRLQRLSSMK